MQSNTNKTIRVGFFVAAAITILVLAIYFIGSKNNFFSPKAELKCVFKDVKGVVQGNNVRFSGINIGNVKSIEITSDSTVEVTMTIREDYTQYIYKDSKVQISQDGLMGNKILIIIPGNRSTGHVEEGDVLMIDAGLDMDNLLAQVNGLLTSTKSTMANLDSITTKINGGEGDVGELLTKKTLTSKIGLMADNLNSTITSVNGITNKINAGKGDLGKLINGNEITAQTQSVLSGLNTTTNNANNVLSELTKTTNSINSGTGTLGMLLNNKKTAGNVDTTILKVNSGLDQLNSTLKTVENSWILNIFSKKKKYTHEKSDSIK